MDGELHLDIHVLSLSHCRQSPTDLCLKESEMTDGVSQESHVQKHLPFSQCWPCQVSLTGHCNNHWHLVRLEKILCCSVSLYMILGPDTQPSYWQLKATSWHLYGQVESALGRAACFKSLPLRVSSHERARLGSKT